MDTKMEVYAIQPPSAEDRDYFLKMKAVWDACRQAGVAVPDKVRCYFDDKPPGDGPADHPVRLFPLQGDAGCPIRPYRRAVDSLIVDEGYEVYLDKLPAGTKAIRFVCRR